MNNLLNFFTIAEHLHYERRTTELSNGEKESVSSHMWTMALMAIVFSPKLENPVNLEHVLKLIIVHDLAEAETGDIPVHEQIKCACAESDKHCGEQCVMEKFRAMVGNFAGDELYDLWNEYEQQETLESRFVKALDKLEVDLAVSCSKSLKYVGEYDNNVYWRIYFADARSEPFLNEPLMMSFFLTIREKIEARMRSELGLNPEDFKEQNV